MAFDDNYDNRDGFNVAFLRPGKLDGRVFLPILGDKLAGAGRAGGRQEARHRPRLSPLQRGHAQGAAFRDLQRGKHRLQRALRHSPGERRLARRPAHRPRASGDGGLLREQPVRPRPPDASRRPRVRRQRGERCRCSQRHLPLDQLHAAGRQVQRGQATVGRARAAHPRAGRREGSVQGAGHHRAGLRPARSGHSGVSRIPTIRCATGRSSRRSMPPTSSSPPLTCSTNGPRSRRRRAAHPRFLSRRTRPSRRRSPTSRPWRA